MIAPIGAEFDARTNACERRTLLLTGLRVRGVPLSAHDLSHALITTPGWLLADGDSRVCGMPEWRQVRLVRLRPGLRRHAGRERTGGAGRFDDPGGRVPDARGKLQRLSHPELGGEQGKGASRRASGRDERRLSWGVGDVV